MQAWHQWFQWLARPPCASAKSRCLAASNPPPHCVPRRPSPRHVAYFPAAPNKLTDQQLARLAAPTLVVAAEWDIFGPGEATAERARRVLPDCEAVVLPASRHFGSTRITKEVVDRVVAFFEARGLAGGAGGGAGAGQGAG